MNGILSVRQELCAHDFQVAHVHRYVLWFDRSAQHLDHLEALAQLHQVAEVLQRAGAPPVLDVHDVGRSGGRRHGHVPPAERHVVGGIERVQRERMGRVAQRLRDQPAVQAHQHRILIDLRAAGGIARAAIGRQHLHALGFEDVERGPMYRLDLIVGEHAQRLERVFEVPVVQRPVGHRRQRLGRTGSPTTPARGAHFMVTHSIRPAEFPIQPPARTRPKRSISQERNNATAASLSASGCVIR